MVRRSEIVAVYIAAIIQGIALVTFPAASTIFTSPAHYGLTSTEYGAMFVPQAVLAIGASLLGAGFTRALGPKPVYLLGLVANLLAMALLVISQFVMGERTLAYGLLLVATTCLGIGFGTTVPAINTLAAGFFPRNADSAVLALNALLGLGTALAPVFIALFVGLGIWWGLPILVGALAAILLLFSLSLPFRLGSQISARRPGKTALPAKFWVFAAFALVYGIVETINGNWATLYMTQHLGTTAMLASLALTTFWGSVTVGRILFALIESWFPAQLVFRLLPFVVAVAFVVAASLPKANPALGLLTFGMAGLGCSALLPLIISFGQKQMRAIAASAAGYLIGFYQIGYGIAAFGVGPLQQNAGLSLNVIFGWSTVAGLVLVGLSFAIPMSEDEAPPRSQQA
jgi:MFS family permease